MNITDHLLNPNEYYADKIKKEIIFIHHTAGGHRPDYTIDSWAQDKSKSGGHLPVATSFVIGGKSITNGNTDFDGHIYRAFPEDRWAHHLGLQTGNNTILNQKSIAIEVCNYGPCSLNKDGKFINYVNKEVPADMVGTLVKPFRGFTHYHKYTTAQIESLKLLLQDLSLRFDIDLKQGLQYLVRLNDTGAFEISTDALLGKPGLWTHTNVRADKSDMWPQTELLDMIKSL